MTMEKAAARGKAFDNGFVDALDLLGVPRHEALGILKASMDKQAFEMGPKGWGTLGGAALGAGLGYHFDPLEDKLTSTLAGAGAGGLAGLGIGTGLGELADRGEKEREKESIPSIPSTTDPLTGVVTPKGKYPWDDPKDTGPRPDADTYASYLSKSMEAASPQDKKRWLKDQLKALSKITGDKTNDTKTAVKILQSALRKKVYEGKQDITYPGEGMGATVRDLYGFVPALAKGKITDQMKKKFLRGQNAVW